MELRDGMITGNQFSVLLCYGNASRRSVDLFSDAEVRAYRLVFWICLLLYSSMDVTISSFFKNAAERTNRTLVVCSFVFV